jgi:hypothetical protein
MVPDHPFNEMKPNSGDAALEHDRSTAEKFLEMAICTQKRLDIVTYARSG